MGRIYSDSPSIVFTWLYFFQIAYSLTDMNFHEEHLFRGLPSDLFLAEAMIQLLATFEWNRVGVVYSEELSYARVGTLACTACCGFQVTVEQD